MRKSGLRTTEKKPSPSARSYEHIFQNLIILCLWHIKHLFADFLLCTLHVRNFDHISQNYAKQWRKSVKKQNFIGQSAANMFLLTLKSTMKAPPPATSTAFAELLLSERSLVKYVEQCLPIVLCSSMNFCELSWWPLHVQRFIMSNN